MLKNSDRILDRLYTELSNCLRMDMKKKLPSESLFISTIFLKNNDVLRALAEASYEAYKIPSDVMSELQEGGYIRQTEDPGKITITAKGVWYVEMGRSILTEELLVSFIDNKIFDKFEEVANLNEREKVIVLALLAMRAFSFASSADMKKDRDVRLRWLEVMLSSYDLLQSIGAISKLTRDDLLKENYEEPASHLFRHNVDLPKKTNRIYTSKGVNRYYLDLYSDKKLDVGKISLLFKAVFQKQLRIENSKTIEEFCKNMAYRNAAFLFDLDSHEFANPRIDDVIKEGLDLALLESGNF